MLVFSRFKKLKNVNFVLLNSPVNFSFFNKHIQFSQISVLSCFIPYLFHPFPVLFVVVFTVPVPFCSCSNLFLFYSIPVQSIPSPSYSGSILFLFHPILCFILFFVSSYSCFVLFLFHSIPVSFFSCSILFQFHPIPVSS